MAWVWAASHVYYCSTRWMNPARATLPEHPSLPEKWIISSTFFCLFFVFFFQIKINFKFSPQIQWLRFDAYCHWRTWERQAYSREPLAAPSCRKARHCTWAGLSGATGTLLFVARASIGKPPVVVYGRVSADKRRETAVHSVSVHVASPILECFDSNSCRVWRTFHAEK